MSTILDVVNFLGRIPNGVTRPVKIQANDENMYVMKYIHDSCSGKILFNELIAYRLGLLLGIPMPNCFLGKLDQELINKTPLLSDLAARPCTCFLSYYLQGTPKISPMLAKNVMNQNDIAKILVFDQIILNNDRAKNDGNLFYDRKNKRVVAIDHSHIFINGEIWSENELNLLADRSPVVVENLLGRNYRVFSMYLKGHSCFHEIQKTIINLSETDVRKIFEDIPEDWQIPNQEIESCFKLILKQLKEVDGIISLLQNVYSIRKGG